MQRFTIFKNLHFLRSSTIKRDLSYSTGWKWDQAAKQLRDDYVIKMMRKHYTEEEVQNVLSYRRSDGTDKAVIADFMTNEFEKHHIIRDEHYLKAIRVVKEQMRPNRTLHPIAYPDLRGYNWTLNVSAERPWTDPDFRFIPKGADIDNETGKPRVTNPERTKLVKYGAYTTVETYLKQQQRHNGGDGTSKFHNLYNEIFYYNRTLIHQIKDGLAPFWKDGQPVPYESLKLHLRTHVVAEDKPDKVRAVFGAPKLLLMAENMFIWPIQATYQTTDVGKLFWNREIARGGFTKLMNEFNTGRSNTFISMDWSGFDRRLLHEMIDDVHNIWREYFDFSQYEPTSDYPYAPVDEERIERLWTWMTSSIKRTPIELPDGTTWEWRHNGFGSGYQQTQLMDTFCNMLMTYTVLSSLGIDIEADDFKSRFQGDDAILSFAERSFGTYGKKFLTMMAEKALYYFNAILSDDKSSIGQHFNDIYCLGYNNVYGEPTRTDADLLSHLMFPEHAQDFGRLKASSLGLCYASLGCSRRFYATCHDIFHDINDDLTAKHMRAFKWMKKSGMEEILEQLENGRFPSMLELIVLGMEPKTRTRLQDNKSWPVFKATSEQRTIFLNSL